MSVRRIGLSSKQPVPRLLSVIGNTAGNEAMKTVPDDAPPLDSSDLSDEDGLPTRADIQPTRFSFKAREKRPSPSRGPQDREAARRGTAAALPFKRTRASAREVPVSQPSSSPKATTDRQSPAAKSTGESSPPAVKKLKGIPPEDGELGSQFADDVFSLAHKKAVIRRYGGPKTFGGRAPQNNRLRKGSAPEVGRPERRKKLRMPSSPSKGKEEPVSPPRRLKSLPDDDMDPPADLSPVRRARLEMPDEDDLGLFDDLDSPEESRRPVLKIPDELPEISGGDEDRPMVGLEMPPTDDASAASIRLRCSTSPLTDLESLDETPRCPLCNKEVDQALLDEFKERHAQMTVYVMRKFCELHKTRSARQAWQDRGYPDIAWHGLEARMARHYDFLRGILEGGRESHYRERFQDSIRSGGNRTLLRSDANLTPGYYGIRGLRAMSENLVSEFSSLLYKTAREDRLVSARGATAFLQAVLVPELAVRLIMEDMGVGEEEARGILAESSWVGELLNDEIPDVVLEDSEDEMER